MNVVMVHGFLNTGRQFGTLGRMLASRGHACHAPTLHPRDGRLGIPDLSAKLASFIEGNIPRGAPLALVGFSMGALVARHYLQALGGAQRAKAYFSIAGPHEGTRSAYLYPSLGTRQMRPGSAFLLSLAAGARALETLPTFTYRTPFDLMVIPHASARIQGAGETVLWCPLHALLTRDRQLGAHIAGELATLEARTAHQSGEPTHEPAV
jgi:triacylglycerol lipase